MSIIVTLQQGRSLSSPTVIRCALFYTTSCITSTTSKFVGIPFALSVAAVDVPTNLPNLFPKYKHLAVAATISTSSSSSSSTTIQNPLPKQQYATPSSFAPRVLPHDKVTVRGNHSFDRRYYTRDGRIHAFTLRHNSGSTSNVNNNDNNNTTTLQSTTSPKSNNGQTDSPSLLSSPTHHDYTIQPPPGTTPTTTVSSKSNRYSRWIRKNLGGMVSTVGFVSSAASAIVRNPQQVLKQTQEPLKAIRQYLQQSGMDLEISQSLNRHLAMNVALLGKVHLQQQQQGNSSADTSWWNQLTNEKNKINTTVTAPFQSCQTKSSTFWKEARRYMRFATAVYGPSMIHAAQIDARGMIDTKHFFIKNVGQLSLDTISHHVGIPAKDIVLADVDYDSQETDHHLRHFIAVDHVHRKVILAIRGTFSLQEVIVDIASYSRENFCGGEAHAGMASMAERVWNVASPTITNLLNQHRDYELILTGHSLGAGTACLLTILLQQQQQQQQQQSKSRGQTLLPKDTRMRCFAYACPPVFTPYELVPQASKLTTHFIHENDVVPSLSVFSVRSLLGSLRAIQDYHVRSSDNNNNNKMHKLSWMDKLAIVTGARDIPNDLIQAVQEAPPVAPKRGAPRLSIPAAETIWLEGLLPDREHYTYRIIRKNKSAFPIRVLPNMLVDHLPSRYEYALNHLMETHTHDDEDDEKTE